MHAGCHGRHVRSGDSGRMPVLFEEPGVGGRVRLRLRVCKEAAAAGETSGGWCQNNPRSAAAHDTSPVRANGVEDVLEARTRGTRWMLLSALLANSTDVAAALTAMVNALSRRCALAENASRAIAEPTSCQSAGPWAGYRSFVFARRQIVMSWSIKVPDISSMGRTMLLLISRTYWLVLMWAV